MKKLLLLICLILSQITFAQTLEMPNFPDGVNIYDVSIKNELIDFAHSSRYILHQHTAKYLTTQCHHSKAYDMA